MVTLANDALISVVNDPSYEITITNNMIRTTDIFLWSKEGIDLSITDSILNVTR